MGNTRNKPESARIPTSNRKGINHSQKATGIKHQAVKSPTRTGREEKARSRERNLFRPSSLEQRRRGEKRPRVELAQRVPGEILPCRSCVERLHLTRGWTLERRTRPRPRAHLGLPVREVMRRRLLYHAEVRRLWVRCYRIRMCAAGTAVAGKLVLRPGGLCWRLNAGLCLRLYPSLLSSRLGLKGPDLGLLLLLMPAELLHELVIGACTTARAQWGDRRLRVQRGSLRRYLDARVTLFLGRRPALLKVVKMVGRLDLHLCHCRVP